MAGRGNGFERGAIWQTAGLVLLGVVTFGLCVLALTRDVSSDSLTAISNESASASPTPSSTASVTSTPAPVEDPPRVKDQRNTNFTTGGGLPDGSRTYDNPSVGSPLALADGLLSHGAPTGPEAISSLETRLTGEVQKISARVRFAAQNPGSVVLVAWQDSLVDARTADQPVPTSGLRLVASSGSWQLTTYERTPRTLQSGTYDAPPGPVTFTVYRQEDTAWVVDPAGTVTQVQDPRIASFAGPWACWQLYEKAAAEVPAVIEAVSAG